MSRKDQLLLGLLGGREDVDVTSFNPAPVPPKYPRVDRKHIAGRPFVDLYDLIAALRLQAHRPGALDIADALERDLT